MTGEPNDISHGHADPARAQQFAEQFSDFMSWAHESGRERDREPVVQLLRDHLAERADLSIVSRGFSSFEQVNLQRALDAWRERDGRAVRVQGLSIPPQFSPVNLGQCVHGGHLPPTRLVSPEVTDLPSGPGRTLACWNRVLLLVEDSRGRYVVMVSGPQEHQDPSVTLEIAGLEVAAAQQVFAELDQLRGELNVYRGHVVSVATNMMGFTLDFVDPPATTRADVILDDAVLDRIDRHALDISENREALLAAGQHLKRGLLLYGPPGTGKTHTVRYLTGARTDATRILLQGEALRVVGSVAALARELAPSVIVLEDVDLVAEDRSYGEVNSVLFELLDAMDGSAPDADLLFVLTTNRAEVLERALTQRPGRVDVAVEVGRPDAAAREQLLRLYGGALLADLTDTDLESVVERTDGVTASFIKELLRRAVLESLHREDSAAAPAVTSDDVTAALDDLLDQGQRVTRALLGLSDAGDEAGIEDFEGAGFDSEAVVAGDGPALGGMARPGLSPAVSGSAQFTGRGRPHFRRRWVR